MCTILFSLVHGQVDCGGYKNNVIKTKFEILTTIDSTMINTNNKLPSASKPNTDDGRVRIYYFRGGSACFSLCDLDCSNNKIYFRITLDLTKLTKYQRFSLNMSTKK